MQVSRRLGHESYVTTLRSTRTTSTPRRALKPASFRR